MLAGWHAHINSLTPVLPACACTQVFPKLPAPGGENAGFSECARYNLAARPRKGDALLFHR